VSAIWAIPHVKTQPRARPRVGLFNLNSTQATVFQDCFSQFGINTLAINDTNGERFSREKLEGCVVGLYSEGAPGIVESARRSSANHQIVIYGLYRSMEELRDYTKYGINVLIHEPLQWMDCVKAARSSRSLLLHELRRYIRLPLATAVAVNGTPAKFQATSVEISEGGMSINIPHDVSILESLPLRVMFSLPASPDISVQAQVCWVHRSENMVGLRFDRKDPATETIKLWISKYLQL
jgi:hypothetical protein